MPAAWQGAEKYIADGQITRQLIQCALDYTDEDDRIIAAFRDEEFYDFDGYGIMITDDESRSIS